MFFMLPVAVDYQARRYPVVTFTIMGLNAVLYLASICPLMASNSGLMRRRECARWWRWARFRRTPITGRKA
jgi:hypothetical protein